MLVITCGLPGTGKSTVARNVARRIDAEVIRSDVVRKTLAGMDPREHALEEHRAGLYGQQMTERTYRAMFDAAREHLMSGRSVVLDAMFLRRAQRKAAARLARETGAQFACVEIKARESAIRQRLEGRLQRGKDVSDARWVIYLGEKRRFQKPTEVPVERLIGVDTTRPRSRITGDVLDRLRRLSPLSVPKRPA
jgi:predicted kinase